MQIPEEKKHGETVIEMIFKVKNLKKIKALLCWEGVYKQQFCKPLSNTKVQARRNGGGTGGGGAYPLIFGDVPLLKVYIEK